MSYRNSLSLPMALVVVGLVFGFAGCTKYIDFEGDDATPRLVVNGLVTPDSPVSVTLSNSVGYLNDGDIERQVDGVVTLRDGDGALIEVLQHTGNGVYSGSTDATAGARYRIEVDHPGFESVSADDRVPLPVTILSLDTSTVLVDNFFGPEEGLEFRFRFADPSGEANFYLLEVFQRIEYYIDFIFDPNNQGQLIPDTVWYTQPVWESVFMSSSDQVIASENSGFLGDAQSFGSKFYFSDALFDGTTREFTVRGSTGESWAEGTQYRLRLSSLSEAYYLYRQTLRSFDNTNGDPFAQPVQVYSNIFGGLGIFGSSSFDERTVD